MVPKIYSKKGNMIVSTPIILLICIIVVIGIGISVINLIEPFIWYEKLHRVSNKYMFVIEKYGYLTLNEKQMLLQEMQEEGFSLSSVGIQCPEFKKDYGELIEFEISYTVSIKTLKFEYGKLVIKDKLVPIIVRKNSYSKV